MLVVRFPRLVVVPLLFADAQLRGMLLAGADVRKRIPVEKIGAYVISRIAEISRGDQVCIVQIVEKFHYLHKFFRVVLIQIIAIRVLLRHAEKFHERRKRIIEAIVCSR